MPPNRIFREKELYYLNFFAGSYSAFFEITKFNEQIRKFRG